MPVSRSYAFSLRLVRALLSSFPPVTVALVDPCQHPAFVFINASAWQLHSFWHFVLRRLRSHLHGYFIRVEGKKRVGTFLALLRVHGHR